MELGHLEAGGIYVYTELPRSNCTGVALKYVNFCYDLVNPSSQRDDQTVSELYILSRTDPSAQQFLVRAIIPFVTDVSSCEGTMFERGGFSLCCIIVIRQNKL